MNVKCRNKRSYFKMVALFKFFQLFMSERCMTQRLLLYQNSKSPLRTAKRPNLTAMISIQWAQIKILFIRKFTRQKKAIDTNIQKQPFGIKIANEYHYCRCT